MRILLPLMLLLMIVSCDNFSRDQEQLSILKKRMGKIEAKALEGKSFIYLESTINDYATGSWPCSDRVKDSAKYLIEVEIPKFYKIKDSIVSVNKKMEEEKKKEEEKKYSTHSKSQTQSYSSTCGARTKSGGICHRKVSGGGRCWQH